MDELTTKANEYTEFFFNAVVERLIEAGAPDQEYQMPAITLTTTRTMDEDLELNRLRKDMLYAKLEMAHLHKEDINKILISRFGFDPEQRMEYLESKLPHGCRGEYDDDNDSIRITEDEIEEGYDTLSHELLHAVRNKVVPEKNLGYSELLQIEEDELEEGVVYISPEVTEFHSQLDKIVINSVCRERYKEAVTEIDFPSIESLRKVHEVINNDVAGYILDIIDKYHSARKTFDAARKAIKRTGLETTFGEIQQYNEFTGMIDYFNKIKDYLLAVSMIPGSTIEILNIDLIRLRYFVYSKRFDEEFWDFAAYLEKFFNKEIKLIDSARPYVVSRLAINESIEELAENWPSVFLMSGEEIQARYINPVHEEISKMQKTNRYQRLLKRMHERKLRKLVDKGISITGDFRTRKPAKKRQKT